MAPNTGHGLGHEDQLDTPEMTSGFTSDVQLCWHQHQQLTLRTSKVSEELFCPYPLALFCKAAWEKAGYSHLSLPSVSISKFTVYMSLVLVLQHIQVPSLLFLPG